MILSFFKSKDLIPSSITKLVNLSSTNCPASRIFFKTDKNSLYRIIFNLLENASKFGKNISIYATKKFKTLTIEIEDDGPGIPDKFKEKIFKPFYKIDDSRNLNKGGSGLGLSIANELIKKLKGKITLKDSLKTKGTIFSISLIED